MAVIRLKGTKLFVAKEAEFKNAYGTGTPITSITHTTGAIPTNNKVINTGKKNITNVVVAEAGGVTLTPTTHYTVEADTGIVTILGTAPSTTLLGYVVTFDYSLLEDGTYVEVTSAGLSPSVETVNREVITSGFIGQPPVVIRESVTGNIDLELIAKPTATPLVSGGADLNGDVLFENLFGVKELAGIGTGAKIGYTDVSTTGSAIYEVTGVEVGTANLFKFATPDVAQTSLCTREYMGGKDDVVLESNGVVVESATINFNTAAISTVSFKVGGCGFENITTPQYIPTATCVNNKPYVGKEAVIVTTLGGTPKVYQVKSITVDLNKTISNIESLDAAGYSSKVTTMVEVTAELSVIFEDFASLDAFKNNTDVSLYLRLATANTAPYYEVALYIPKAKISAYTLNKGDIIEASMTLTAFQDCSVASEPILLASGYVA